MSVVANVAINVDSRGATQKLRQVQSQSQATERAVNGLGAAVGKLAAAFSAIQAAKFVFVQTAELEKQTRSLEVLTGSATKAAQIIKELKDIGAVTPFTSTELIDSAKRLQAFGVETNKVVETTRRLADVSGATGAELQGLVTAYGQVQAKGRLQGEELLQFQERGVALQQVLRQEYKLSGEEFQDALSKGRISAEAVEFAIQKLTDAGGKYADGAIAQSDTLAGRLSTLQDAVQNLAQRLGTILAPAMQSILGLAIDIANQINNVFETILLQRQLGANLAPAQRNKLFQQAEREALDITKGRFGVDIFGRPKNQADFTKLREERFRDLMRTYGYQQGILTPPTAAPPTAAATLPGLMEATGKGKGKGADKAAAEEARLQARLRGLQIETQGTFQLALIKGKIAEAEIAGNKELAIRLQGEQRNQQILLNLQRSLIGVTDEREKQALQVKALADLEAAGIETAIDMERQRLDVIKEQNKELFKRAGFTPQDKMGKGAGAFDPSLPDLRVSPAEQQIAKYRKELDELANPINMAVTGANAIGDAFGQAFQDIATGAKSTQEALADAFKGIGQAFIQMATEIIAKQLAMIAFQTILKALGGGGSFGFSGEGPAQLPSGSGFAEGFSLPKLYAEGGFVTGPTNALIGEGGEPEYVIPASKMRDAMSRYAGGARGSSVIPSSSEGGAEQGGGIAVATPIDVRYTVERINSVDYVTADQFQVGMRQAAEQGARRGEQRALTNIRQNTNTRRRLGL